MNKLITSTRIFIILAIIFGFLYPFSVTIISKYLFPIKANGSLIIKDGEVIGSKLIAQEFTQRKYFHSRPSFANYDAANSRGSNYGPLNAKWLNEVVVQIKKYRKENALASSTTIPPDAVNFSGSGLDPHISYDNALLQMYRVASSRNISVEKVKKLILENIDHDFIGIWGRAGVNVLTLNLALDALGEKK